MPEGGASGLENKALYAKGAVRVWIHGPISSRIDSCDVRIIYTGYRARFGPRGHNGISTMNIASILNLLHLQ